MSHTGDMIRKARAEKGVSQVEISKHFYFKSPQFISNVERGLSLWPANKARDICHMLGINIDKFLLAMSKDLREKSERDYKKYRKNVK
jgi:ribosome-binding protein aMBF1 (putative translation factor)